MKKLLILIVCCSSLIVTACSWMPGVYKIDIQQGNIIDARDLNQVRTGMTQSQVRYILGTPIIQDAFHQDRWDYIYTMTPGGKKTEKKNVTLYFEKQKLVKIEGTVLPDPNARKDLSEINKQSVVTVTPQPRKKPSLWRRIFLGVDEDEE